MKEYSHAPEANPYSILNTITPPVFAIPNMAQIRTPVMKHIGTKTLNFPK